MRVDVGTSAVDKSQCRFANASAPYGWVNPQVFSPGVPALVQWDSGILTYVICFRKMAQRLETADRTRHGYMRSTLECPLC